MDSDGPKTVALTVSASPWRDVVDGLKTPEALGTFADQVVARTLEMAAVTSWLKTGEVSLLLTDDHEVRGLNSLYRSRDRATNVLSFPGLDLTEGKADMTRPPETAVLGDIVMSCERLSAEADELNKPPIDHFTHLLVHGTLHLLGYDHDDDRRADVMETLEAKILKTLGFAAPYPSESDIASAPAAMSTAS